MKFVLVENDLQKMKEEWESKKGYKMTISEEGKAMFGTCDEWRIDQAQDDCWDNDNGIYMGEDGKYYHVVFDLRMGHFGEPLCWHEMVRK